MPTVAGGFGEGPAAQLRMGGQALAVHGDRLYALDLPDNAIRAVDLRGSDHTATLVAGEATFDSRTVFYPDNPNFVGQCPTGVPATSVRLGAANVDLAFDAAGNLYTIACGIYKIDPSGTITAIAVGNRFATAESTGEDVPALKAFLWGVAGVAPDAHGNLYYAEANGSKGYCRIRRITPGADGVLDGSSDELVRSVVGGDTCGFSGDGGPALKARLLIETHLAFDPGGNLYISERGNNRIRKVTPGPDGVIDGGEGEVITTFAGGGTSSCIGGDTGGYGGDGGPADQASLACPRGIAFDSKGENLYVADYGNARVRKVRLGTTCVDPACTLTIENQITTVAGNGRTGDVGAGDGGPAVLAPILNPDDVAVDGDGNLYIKSDNVRKVDTSGIITTFAGARTPKDLAQEGWVATKSELGPGAIGVAVTAGGETYVSDLGYCRVRKVDTSGRITTVAGILPESWPSTPGSFACGSSGDGGPATQAEVDPWDVAVDGAGSLYIAEARSCRVRKVDSSGTITTVAGTGTCGFSGDGGAARDANIVATGIHLDGAGNLYLVGAGTCRIRKVSSSGTITTVVGTGTCGPGGDGGPATSAQLNRPREVFADGSGNLYIADTGNCRIRKVSSSGTIATVAGDGTCGRLDQVFEGPATATALPGDQTYSVAADRFGSFYIGVTGTVYRVDASGNLTRVAGGFGFPGEGAPPKDTALGTVHHLDVDAAGSVYVASTRDDNARVRKLSLPDFALSASPPQPERGARQVDELHARHQPQRRLLGAGPAERHRVALGHHRGLQPQPRHHLVQAHRDCRQAHHTGHLPPHDHRHERQSESHHERDAHGDQEVTGANDQPVPPACRRQHKRGNFSP